MNPKATVILPTYNRKQHLRQAIESSLSQTVPVEIIVMDDGSTDGTEEMIAKFFPTVRYFRIKDGPKGPCFLRTQGAELATTNFLFPIDDDAYFASKSTVEQTLADFDSPRIGAIGIPFINIRRGPAILQKAPRVDGIFIIDAFIGASHAVRRDLFLEVGGYHSEFFYMGEEGDLCLRLLDKGYVTRLGTAEALHHMESPLRVSVRAAKYGRQNDVLFALYNVPFPELLIHLPITILNGWRFALLDPFKSRIFSQLHGHCLGMWIGLKKFFSRTPVSRKCYHLSRLLKKEKPVNLVDVEEMLPRLCQDIGNQNISA